MYTVIGIIWCVAGLVWLFTARLQFSMKQKALGWVSIVASLANLGAGVLYFLLAAGS